MNIIDTIDYAIRFASGNHHQKIVKLLIVHPKIDIDIIKKLAYPDTYVIVGEVIKEYTRGIINLHNDILEFLKTDYSDTDFLELLKSTKDVYGWGV